MSEAASSGRIGALDGWRAIAILSVLYGHFFGIEGFNIARMGVELFFVLSARLMAEILFVKQQRLSTFFWRRSVRVWPALFVFIAAIAAASLAIHDPIPAIHILGALTFVQNCVSIYFGHQGRIDHLWSLSIEEWTYVGLALVAFLTRSRGAVLATLLAVAVIMIVNGIWQTASGGDYYAVYWRTDVRAASILMGAAAYLLLAGRRVSPAVPLVSFALAVCLSIDAVPDTLKYTIGTALFAISIATLGNIPLTVDRVLSSAPLRHVALVSFSLYLWQQPFFMFMGKHNNILLLLGAIVVAHLSYYLVEGPSKAILNSIGILWTAARC